MASPEEVPRGAACNCVCPGCNRSVIARQGTEREWHFAHAKGDACQEGYEVSVHELAKQIIRQRCELLLPALDVAVSATDAFGQFIEEREHVLDSRKIHLDECWTGKLSGEATVDVIGRVRDREILVEITVFHRLMPEKLERLVSTGIASLQIDLAEFKVTQATRSKIEAAIFENERNRHWLYHPLIQDARQKAKRRLDAKLVDRQREWDEREAARLAQAERANKLQGNDACQPFSQSVFSSPRAPSVFSASPREMGPTWRASFPPPEKVQHACHKLSNRTGLDLATLNGIIGTVTRRSQLATTTPIELASKWAAMLNVPESEIFQLFDEAGYTLIS